MLPCMISSHNACLSGLALSAKKAARMDVTQQVSIAGAAADYMQKLDAVEAAQKVLLDEQLLLHRSAMRCPMHTRRRQFQLGIICKQQAHLGKQAGQAYLDLACHFLLSQVLGVQQLARMQVSGDSSVFFDFVFAAQLVLESACQPAKIRHVSLQIDCSKRQSSTTICSEEDLKNPDAADPLQPTCNAHLSPFQSQ